MSYKRPAIFLDRDGTLIEEVNYLSRVEGSARFFLYTRSDQESENAGFLLIVVTNQSGIGQGHLRRGGDARDPRVDPGRTRQRDRRIFIFARICRATAVVCRKPDLGMIDAARAEFEIEMENSWMVTAIKEVDVETGHAANLKNALVLTGYGPQHYPLLEREPTLVSDDLGTAAAAHYRFSCGQNHPLAARYHPRQNNRPSAPR